ncbi:MAG TPA: hypothetical protein VIS10_09355 [Anaerolineales bacterium]
MITPDREYHPELIPRRGEWIAWGSTLVVSAAWIILRLSGQSVFVAVPFLAITLLLVAMGISLGNWMDRRTVIHLGDDGVKFDNGLRNVNLSWPEVHQVRVLPSRFGKKVQVFGEQVYFSFRTLGEVHLQGELKGRMGFEKGEEILRQIVLMSGLQIMEREGEEIYYIRP